MLRRSILISGISGLAAFSGLALAQSMSSTSAEKALPYSKRLKLKNSFKTSAVAADSTRIGSLPFLIRLLISPKLSV